MSFIDPLLSNPLVPRLGWALVHFVWQGAAIAALLAIAMLALQRRSANARYLVACMGLVLMAAALPVTMMLVPAGPMKTPTASVAAVLPPPDIAIEPVPPPGPELWQPTAATESLFMAPAPVAPSAEVEAKPLPPWYQRAVRYIEPLLPWAVLLWLAGVCSLSVRLVAGWVMVQRLRRQLVRPVTEATQALLDRLARRLAVSRPVRIVESAIAQVPSAIGWLRPVILLPASALAGLTTQQLEAVIAHELAHIRRYDYLVNLIQSAIETLLFYHPAVWWVSRRIRLEREHCCDDIAVAVCGDARAYARALSEMESLRSPRLVAAAGGGPLLERIRRLVGPRSATHYQYGRFTAGLLVAAAVVVFVVLIQFSSPDALAGDKPDASHTTDASATTRPADEADEAAAVMMSQPTSAEPPSTGPAVSDTQVYQLETSLASLRQDRETLINRVGSEHRTVQVIDAQIESVEAQLKELEVRAKRKHPRPPSTIGEAGQSPDFDLGIWNLALRQYARTYDDDGAFRVIDLDFPDIVPQVSPTKSALAADASRATAAERAGKGDLVVPDAATLQPIRGCILAPLVLPPAEAGRQRQQIIYDGLKDKNLDEVAARIRIWREEHPGEDAIRLEPGKHYGALRPDGTLVVMGAHGEPGNVWVQFIPIGRLADPAATSQPSNIRIAIWDPTIPALRAQVGDLKRQHEVLIDRLGPEHKSVQIVGTALQRLESALKELPTSPATSEADARAVEHLQAMASFVQILIDAVRHRDAMVKLVGPGHGQVQKLDDQIESLEQSLNSLARQWESKSYSPATRPAVSSHPSQAAGDRGSSAVPGGGVEPTTRPAAGPSSGAPVSPQSDEAVRAELARLKLGLAVEHQKQMEALNRRENPTVSGPRMAGVQLITAQCYRAYYGQFGFDPPAPFPRHAEEYETLRSRWEKAEGDEARAAVVKELLARTDKWLAEAEANVEKAKAESKLPAEIARAAVEAGKTAFLAGKMANYPLPHAPGRIEPDGFCLEFLRKHAPALPDVATIAGTVLEATGEPAANVTVYITSATEDREGGIVRTDESGAFRSKPLPLGRYFVSAFRHVTPQDKNWEGQPGYVMGHREQVEVKHGQESTVQLRPAGNETISVTLAQPGPHHLEWGVIFVARSPIDMDATAPPAELKLPPDLLGFFFVRPGATVRIHNLPAGTVHVLATPSDPGPLGFSESTPVEIKAGQPNTVRLALGPRRAADRSDNDSTDETAPAPDARAAVQGYLDAALAGRAEDAAKLGTPRSAVGRQAEAIREIGGPVQVERVYVGSEAALAVTSAVKDERGRTGRLIFDVQKSADGWLIRNTDFEDDEGLETETERFFERHPEAWPPEEADAGAQVRPAPLLAFRIAPNAASSNRTPSLEAGQNYQEELEESGPEANRRRNDPFQWFEVAEHVEESPTTTIATWQGRRYMLLCARDIPLDNGVHPAVTSQGDERQPTWNLKRVYAAKQAVIDRPAIGFELDEEGGLQLRKLSAANLNNDLAILLAGRVISSANLRSEIGSHGMISGSFTRAQVEEIVATLKATIPPPAETRPATEQALLEERIEELASQVRHADERVRKQAVRELGEMKDRRAVPALVEALKDSAGIVRTRAVWALIRIPDERAIAPLIERLQQDDDSGVRAGAAAALGNLPGEAVTQALVQALQDNDVRVRKTAAQHLEAMQWDPTNPANRLRRLLALGRLDEAAELAPKAEVSDDRRRAEGPLVFNTPILVTLQCPAADSGYSAAIDWVEFIPTGNPVLVKLNASYPSGPKAKWRVLVKLLDANGRTLAEEGAIVENSGVIAGVPVTMERMLEVDLGPQTDLLGASRFVVTFVPAKEEPTPEKSDLDPPAVLAGQIFDPDHRPIPDVKVHIYSGIATYYPLGEVVTDAEGRYRFEIRSAAGVWNEAARRWDFTIGMRLEHPDYKSIGPDLYTRTIPGIAGRVTTCYFAMNPIATASRPATESPVSRLPRNPSSRPAPGEGVGGPAGVVLLPDGQPAANAIIVLVRPAAVQYAYAAQFLNGQIQDARSSLMVRTGADGRFSFSEQEEPFRIVVLHDDGYGEATMEPTSFEKIALERWGRVEGQFALTGTKGHREKILLDTLSDAAQDAGLVINHRCETQTDEQGQFVLERVVPRYGVVGREATVAKAKSMTMALDHGVGVEVKPGATARVTVGGTGRRVTGKLVAGEDVMVDFRRAFAYLYLMPNAPLPVPPSETEDRMAWYEKWAASDEGKAYQRATNTRYLVPVNDDGSFRVEDLPPDEYRVMAMVHKLNEGPSWGPGEPIGAFNDVVVVEDGPRDEPFVLEDLELAPQATSMVAAAKTMVVRRTAVEPFAIYRVVEPAETRHAEGVPLHALGLDSRPLITTKDIVGYDWDTHTLELTEAAFERLPAKIPVEGVPFVVVVNGERCYLGAFWTVLSSYMPKVPLIYTSKEIGGPADTIRIQAPPIQGTPDPRSDDRVKNVLESADRLKHEATAIAPAKSTRVAGKVLDRAGRPIAGARLVLYHDLSRWGLDNRVVEETRSSADGTYAFKTPLTFERPIPHAYAQDSFIILATHADHALGWLNITPGDERSDYTLHLTEPQTQTVKVVDADDKPLEGVRVWVYGAGDPQGKDVLLRESLFLPTDAGVTGATTNASGEAVVTNLPKTRCNFHAKRPGYAEGIAFHAGQTIRLSKGGTVAGRVLTADDRPVAGAIVRFAAAWRYNFYALARTDEQGRYRIEDLPAAGWDMSAWGSPPGTGTYNVTIRHDDYMTPTFDVAFEPGQVVEDMDIEALPGTLVVCKVVQPETVRPLAGVRLLGFNDQDRIDGYTDADGIFKVRVLGGRTWIEFQSPPDNMFAVEPEGGGRSRSRVEFEAEGERIDVTIAAPPNMGFIISARGTVVDADGKPVAGAKVWAQPAGRLSGATGPACTPETAADVEGRFELARAPAGTDLCLYVETPDRKLAGTGIFEIGDSPETTAPIRVQLRPTASIDMILHDPKRGGEPVRDTRLQVWPRVGEEDIWRTDRSARTDADGRLKMDGILPGLEYSLRDAVYDSMDRAPIDPNNPPYQDRLQLIESPETDPSGPR